MSDALAFDGAWLFAGFLLLVVLLAAGLTLRRYLLERGGGTVECGLRLPGGNWRLGVAAYRTDVLRWYQVFGLQIRPNQVFSRRTVTVLSRRAASTAEEPSLGKGAVVVRCRVAGGAARASGGKGGPAEAWGAHEQACTPDGEPWGPPGEGTVELAMGEEAMTGFLAWLESAPPAPRSYLGQAS
jgi:Protein of unknown function (DUF2550)